MHEGYVGYIPESSVEKEIHFESTNQSTKYHMKKENLFAKLTRNSLPITNRTQLRIGIYQKVILHNI